MIKTSSPYTVCVYCGSGVGTDPAFENAASALGRALAHENFPLVYGGGAIGLMGVAAQACLDAGGKVTGVIPDFLMKPEIAKENLTELVITKNMHERKMEMFTRSDAFVVLPGGIGTLDETVEMLSWCQLGQHQKPIILANINKFWTPFLSMLEHMEEHQFIRNNYKARYASADQIDDIMALLKKAAHP